MTARLLVADAIVTVLGAVHAPGWIAWEGDTITAVGGGEPPRGFEVVEAPGGSAVIPGLVSAHTHVALGGLRGVADDEPFMSWMLEGILPAIQAASGDGGLFAEGARSTARELLAGGVTLVGDNFFRADGVGALRECGQRGIFFQEVFGSLSSSEDDYIAQVRRDLAALERTLDGFPFGYSPHTPWTCPPRVFEAVAAIARAGNRRLSFHLDESVEEHEFFATGTGPLRGLYEARGSLGRYRFGTTPTALLESIGALGPSSVVAHAVQVTAEDIAILARTRTGVVHCPRSNMKLAEGVAPVAAMMDAGVTVALGVDSAASNSRLDMFEEMRTALLCQRAATRSIGRMTAPTALRMATLNGAEVLGFGARAGALGPGRFADWVVVDISQPRHAPVRDVVATVVHACTPQDVVSVTIGGVVRYEREPG